MTSNHYEILGVWRDSTDGEIEERYSLLRDRFADEQQLGIARAADQLASVEEAHSVLSDRARRAAYDAASVSQLTALPDEVARDQRKPLEQLQRTLAAGEELEVLAAAHSGAPGLLALTGGRLAFVWKTGGFGGTKTLERTRETIAAVEVQGQDLLVRDQEQLFRFKSVAPVERAAEIAARLQQSGARETAAPQPSDGPTRAALGIVPEKPRRIIEQALRPDENVHVVFVGAGGQAIVAADDRMLVVKSGFMAGATFGSKTLDFPYDQISGIELHVGAMTGYLQIQTASYQGNLAGSFWSQEKQHDPWKLPNCIPVGRAAASTFQSGLGLVRERIAKGHWTDGIGAQPPAAAPAPSDEAGRGQDEEPTSLAAQLKELATLHEAGALTDEEFQQAKQKLLG